jgi:chromosome segregation ATPase
MKKNINEVLKELKITKPTFYKYFKKNYNLLEPLREKENGIFIYDDIFVNKLKKLISNDKKLINTENIKKKKSFDNYIKELKDRYENQLNELKNDKLIYLTQVNKLQNQLEKKDNLIIEKTEKVEKLLLSFTKVLNDNKLIENNMNKPPEELVKNVKEKVKETNNKNDELEKKNRNLELSLKSSHEQLKRYYKFKKEKEKTLNELKAEYSKLKFFNFLKKRELSDKINEIIGKDFDFVKYISI